MKFTMGISIVPILLGMHILSGCIVPTQSTHSEDGHYRLLFSKEICKTVKMNYLLYLPEDYNVSQKKWPLILFLHGAGERGDDLSKVETHGPPTLIAQGKRSFPFVIVSPQCPEDEWWTTSSSIIALNALLDDIIMNYRIDEDRIYLTGLSMGGFGTWRLACEYPHRFAAIAPICGGGDPLTVRVLKHIPVWAFHGAKDDIVPIKASEEMVEALKQAGGNVRFTVYPESGHDSWTETYENPELYEWFLSHTRGKD